MDFLRSEPSVLLELKMKSHNLNLRVHPTKITFTLKMLSFLNRFRQTKKLISEILSGPTAPYRGWLKQTKNT